MIKILVVDDNVEKINNIVKEINEQCDNEQFEILTSNFVTDAQKIFSERSIDVLILDICLPERPGEQLKKDAGIQLLKRIKGSSRYTYPRFVIAMSEYEELAKEFELDAGTIHSSVVYSLQSNEWKIRLIEGVNTAITILANNKIKRAYDYDIAVICALEEELELVKKSCETVIEHNLADDDYLYYEGIINKEGSKIRIIMTQSTQMGMVPAATLTTKLIYNFSPKYIVMTGITAGIKGKVKMGDVIAAEYAWDYGAGKEVVDGEVSVHMNTIQQVQIDTSVANMIRRLSREENMLADIKKGFIGNKPEHELSIHIGAVASGASVIANPKIVDMIKNDQIRDVIAVEMEIYGVYYAARWSIAPKPKFVAIKSVCDFADTEKDDDFHIYASYTSAKTFEILAKEYFDY